MNDLITSYLNDLRVNDIKESTINKERPTLEQLDRVLNGKIEAATKEDISNFIISWNGTDNEAGRPATEGTKATRKLAIRKFFQWLEKGELVKHIKIKMPRNHLNADEILTTDDINKLLESTDSYYYKSLIAVLFETGARIGEIRKLKVSDFKETDLGMLVTIPTYKTNYPPRNVILPFSAQYIRNYIMYSGKEKGDGIFNLNKKTTYDMLNVIGKKAGITKKVNHHRFRHAQATDMVKRGYNEAIIRKKLGWTDTSPMPANYQHLHDDDVINATLEMAGKTISKGSARVEIKEPDKISLVNAAGQFSKLTEENQELRSKLNELEARIEKHKDSIDLEERIEEYLSKRNNAAPIQIEKIKEISFFDNNLKLVKTKKLD